ncbi:unnamed protein product, partial [Heterotrigona itama]
MLAVPFPDKISPYSINGPDGVEYRVLGNSLPINESFARNSSPPPSPQTPHKRDPWYNGPQPPTVKIVRNVNHNHHPSAPRIIEI